MKTPKKIVQDMISKNNRPLQCPKCRNTNISLVGGYNYHGYSQEPGHYSMYKCNKCNKCNNEFEAKD